MPCITVAWAPSTDPNVAKVMSRVLASAPTLTDKDVVGFKTAAAIATQVRAKHAAGCHAPLLPLTTTTTTTTAPIQMYESPASIDAAVVFNHSSTSDVPNHYEIWVNSTSTSLYTLVASSASPENLFSKCVHWVERRPFKPFTNHCFRLMLDFCSYFNADSRTLALQTAVDAAIIAHAAGTPASSGSPVSVKAQVWPSVLVPGQPPINEGAATIVRSTGPTVLLIGLSIVALMLLLLVTSEKAARILTTLRSVQMHSTHNPGAHAVALA